ncbi:MAG TPA: hypothetical protein VKZ70_03100 [Burkholderiaceae bacterium]|nr:hypothetical protein [Burkholderiaceae bacterium]
MVPVPVLPPIEPEVAGSVVDGVEELAGGVPVLGAESIGAFAGGGATWSAGAFAG